MADKPDPEWIRNLQEVLYSLQCQATDAAHASSSPHNQTTEETRTHAAPTDTYPSADISAVDYSSHGVYSEMDKTREQTSYLGVIYYKRFYIITSSRVFCF